MSSYYGTASVVYKNSFLLVGGSYYSTTADSVNYESSILEYYPDDEEFGFRNEFLPSGRSHAAAVLVDRTIVDCSSG